MWIDIKERLEKSTYPVKQDRALLFPDKWLKITNQLTAAISLKRSIKY